MNVNKSQFRDEVQDYIGKRYDKFMQYQQYALEVLREFHRICERNNIIYYLSYGTLLGAIRDKGIVPWDYDVDVQVPYKEKDKLIKALQTDLDSKYYIHCPEVNKKCRHFILRLSMVGYNSSALHVDVFYLIGTPSEYSKYTRFAKAVKFILKVRYFKLVKAKEESLGRKATYIKFLFYKALFKLVPLRILNYFYNTLCNKYDYDNCEYIMAIGSYKRYKKDLYTQREIIQFEGCEHPIPSRYKGVLGISYDNYENYPPIESRYNEFMNSLTRLEYFDRIYK